jgi:uncharacterized protein (DUF488 family)
VTVSRIATIGGYGFNEQTFVQTLRRATVDTFVDIRQRRGLRGSQYAFLNSTRLQRMLQEAGIRYVYAPELAPTTEVRDAQKKADAASGTLKRDRTELAPEFVKAYRARVLASFDADSFTERLGPATTIALFCVEAQPLACHRSLAADFLRDQIGAPVEHLHA